MRWRSASITGIDLEEKLYFDGNQRAERSVTASGFSLISYFLVI
jgi:hypothetical protein